MSPCGSQRGGGVYILLCTLHTPGLPPMISTRSPGRYFEYGDSSGAYGGGGC